MVLEELYDNFVFLNSLKYVFFCKGDITEFDSIKQDKIDLWKIINYKIKIYNIYLNW